MPLQHDANSKLPHRFMIGLRMRCLQTFPFLQMGEGLMSPRNSVVH
jgi:hypothetical protein